MRTVPFDWIVFLLHLIWLSRGFKLGFVFCANNVFPTSSKGKPSLYRLEDHQSLYGAKGPSPYLHDHFVIFKSTLCSHRWCENDVHLHGINWKHCRAHARPVVILDIIIFHAVLAEAYNKCVSGGQSIEASSPHYFGGAITKLAHLAVHIWLGACTNFIWNSNVHALRVPIFTCEMKIIWSFDVNYFKGKNTLFNISTTFKIVKTSYCCSLMWLMLNWALL